MPGKVLVITYEFPPAGGGGVQRWAKMCRYLPASGWTPIVVTAEPVARRSRDDSLLADVAGIEVHRTPHRHVASAIAGAIEPIKRAVAALRGRSRATRGTVAASESGGGSGMRKAPLSNRIARWIAVPDDAAYWRGMAAREAVRIGREAGVDAVVATGPPFSALVAGVAVARQLGVPCVLDMRDGWQINPVATMPTSVHRALSERLERRALPLAAAVTYTAPAIGQEAERFGARRTVLVPNGYDPADLPEYRPDPGGPLRLVYMGKVYYGHSDPAPLFRAMAEAARAGGAAALVQLEIIGSWPESIKADAAALGIAERVEFVSYLPHHEALARTARADVGTLLIADRPGSEGTCPAKLYEYLGMGMSVILVGNDRGLTARVIAETSGGVTIHPDNVHELAQWISALAERKAAGEPLGTPDAQAVSHYSRPEEAALFATVLDEVTSGR